MTWEEAIWNVGRWITHPQEFTDDGPPSKAVLHSFRDLCIQLADNLGLPPTAIISDTDGGLVMMCRQREVHTQLDHTLEFDQHGNVDYYTFIPGNPKMQRRETSDNYLAATAWWPKGS